MLIRLFHRRMLMFWDKKNSEEEMKKAAQIAGEQIELAESMERLINNADFRKVFFDFRVKQYLNRANESLTRALMLDDVDTVRKAELEIKRLTAIDWYIEKILAYYQKGKQTLSAIYEEESYEEKNNA